MIQRDIRFPGFTLSVPQRAINSQKDALDYSAYTWPSAMLLGLYLCAAKVCCGSTVVELGAGSSLPAAVAVKLGAKRVVATDISLDHMPKFVCLSPPWSQIEPMQLRWGHERDFALFPPFSADIVIGADVLFHPSVWDSVFATVSLLMRRSPGNQLVVIAYQQRSDSHDLTPILDLWDLCVMKSLSAADIIESVWDELNDKEAEFWLARASLFTNIELLFIAKR